MDYNDRYNSYAVKFYYFFSILFFDIRIQSKIYKPGNPPGRRRYLLYIIVAIDDFANLVFRPAQGVENVVSRIARRGRSAGIPLIIATRYQTEAKAGSQGIARLLRE